MPLVCSQFFPLIPSPWQSLDIFFFGSGALAQSIRDLPVLLNALLFCPFLLLGVLLHGCAQFVPFPAQGQLNYLYLCVIMNKIAINVHT